MLPYTGDYIEHVDDNKRNSKYYTFPPRPLIYMQITLLLE